MMTTIINSVETPAAMLVILAARKKPFILSLRAKVGVTEVAMFVLDRFETSAEAQDAMYENFEYIRRYDPAKTYGIIRSLGPMFDRDIHLIPALMRVTEDLFGECVFSLTVEKLEV